MSLAVPPPEAAFSRLDVGASVAPESFSAMLESPPSTAFDLDGVRSREAHRLSAIEEDRYRMFYNRFTTDDAYLMQPFYNR